MNYSIKLIMLVDDDQDDKYFFCKALEAVDADIALYSACDGLDALEKLRIVTPDVILLDLNMPRMNGVAFLKKIKSIRQWSHIPVIVYTTCLTVFDEEEVMELGAYRVFCKPDEFKETVKTISEILQHNFIRMRA